MIDSVITLEGREARTIPPFTVVQIWDEGLSATRLVMCKGHTETWSVFAYDNGYTFRILGSDTLSVVTKIEGWESMSDETRMDLELDLMVRGA